MTTRDDRLSFMDHLAQWITWPRFIFAVAMVFFLTSILFPFYWMVSSSFKTYAEIGGREPVYIPGALRLEAYQELFDFWNFWRQYRQQSQDCGSHGHHRGDPVHARRVRGGPAALSRQEHDAQ